MTGQLAYYSLHELSMLLKKYENHKLTLAIENEETKNGR